MQLHFVGKNIEVTPAIKAFTEEKLSVLKKRFDHITTVNFVFYVEKKTHVAEAIVHYDGTEIHAKTEEDDMYKAIDSVVTKLLNQLTKQKDRIIDSHR